MEESLLRLRRVRDKANLASSSQSEKGTEKSGPIGSDKVSDDDKIRLQLYVDVMHYSKTMRELGIPESEVVEIYQLRNLVTEAAKSCLEATALATGETSADGLVKIEA